MMKGRVIALLLHGCALSFTALGAEVADPVPATTASDEKNAAIAQCSMGCGQELSKCEHGFAVGGHCSRYFQICKDNCTQSGRAENAAALERSRCEQRCDNAGASCQQEHQNSLSACSTGVSACNARCEGVASSGANAKSADRMASVSVKK